MILKFVTKMNKNGHRKQLEIDTNNKTYRHGCFLFITNTNSDCIEIKSKHMDYIIDTLKKDGYNPQIIIKG